MDERHQAVDGPGDAEIERLLRLAGHRPQPEPQQIARARAAVHGDWQRLVRRRRMMRLSLWTGASGLAAAAVLTMVVMWPNSAERALSPDRVVVATLVRDLGVVQVTRQQAGGAPQPLERGDVVLAGDVIETSPGSRAAFTLIRGASLRLDVGSRVILNSDVAVRLEQGALYVDSGEAVAPLQIETAFGRVRDIGTQFEVRLEPASLAVRVREGAIVVRGDGDPVMARAGEGLRVARGQPTERLAIPVAGMDWAWTSIIAPSFVLEGRSLPQFLDWVVREEGLRWRFVDADTRERAAAIVTHGAVDGLTPTEALDVVLPTCGMRAVRDGDELVLSFLEPAR